jgi:hypothetical protein
MKKIYLTFFAIAFNYAFLFSQTPKVYIHLNSHNETSGTGELNYDNNSSRSDYDTAFKYIKQVADMVVAKNAKYNFQSDVKFLLGCLKWDLKTAATSSLNLVKWMDNSPNIECDPHSHEGKYPGTAFGKYYNYSDVAHLHDSLGVTNRKNVGGFKVDGIQNHSNWPDLESGELGTAFSTSGAWKPNVLWGGSYKAGTHNDMNFFGTYKPTLDTNNSSTPTSNNSQRLRIQGNGCSMVLHDSTSEQRLVRELGKIFRNVHYGVYPNTEFYTQVIQFNCRDVYKANFVSRLTTIIDSINNYVSLGWVEWKTISEKDVIWRAAPYDSTYKRIDCVNLPTDIGEQYIIDGLGIYPNPVLNSVTVAHTVNIKSIIVSDALGRVVYNDGVINKESHTINTEFMKSGIYFVIITLDNNRRLTRKILKE